MLSYCVQHLSIEFVRLLLRYGAEINPDLDNLKPAQHAAIRQDRAIIEAVREFGGFLKPNWEHFNPETDDRLTKAAMVGMGVWGSIGHPAAGFACAQASRWPYNNVKKFLVK